ncbi:MAG: DUF1963 domain-containing protein [Lachnospiraceae bacterium]|nr:DUF1963 domain-containing protein [Lachnospiraceae bacterium]
MENFNILEAIKSMARNAIRLTLLAGDGVPVGRFGGHPLVPDGFIWPTFLIDPDNKELKPRPLSFLAQFDCESLAPMDREHLLPKSGILSFFYELCSQSWGFSPEDAGSARVFYFPEKSALTEMDFPADLEENYRLPPVEFFAKTEIQYPDFEDFCCKFPGFSIFNQQEENSEEYNKFCKEYNQAIKTLRGEDNEFRHQLLGWPSIIDNSMPFECEMVGRGYDLGSTLRAGGGYYMDAALKDVPTEILHKTEQDALDNWLLLFQLESDEFADHHLDFSYCGNIYFYIRKTDLAGCLFDGAWLICQCY